MRFGSKDRGTRVQDRARNGASKRARRGWGRKEGNRSPPPPPPSPLHLLALVSFLARPKPRIPFLGLSLLRNQTETLATQASVIQTWLVEPFTEFKSAEHMAKIIQHKSQIRALKPISKCQERKCIKRSSKIKCLQIHKILFENVIFLKYRVQDIPAENSKKTSLLVCISKQAKGSDRLG